MVKSSEEILADIDATLDQLIMNADVMNGASLSELCVSEVGAMQKTQESLVARLVHMNELFEGEKAESFGEIERKVLRFGKLNAKMIERISEKIRRPRVRPHRRKVKV